jgi:hypothetical protein
MNRERALKVVSVLVGWFSALLDLLTMFVRQELALAMMPGG